MKRFWFHYNKPASKKVGKPQITLHWQGQCLLVDNLVCNVKTEGHLRKEQPNFVIRGWAREITICKRVANII